MDDQQRLRELLLEVPPLHDRYLELGALGPAPNSRAMTDLEVCQEGELVRSAAVTTLSNGLDHLLSWAGLFLRAGLLPVYAQYTLLRGAVENVSMARWLVDPKVDPRVRVARGIGYTLADYGERRKFEQLPWPKDAPARPPKSANWRSAAVRSAALEDRAAVAGLCPLRIGQTEVVSRFGPGEASYRLLSAFAHGGQAIPFAAADLEDPSDADAGGLYTVRATASLSGSTTITESAVFFARLALAEVYAYHGRDATSSPPTELLAV